MSMNLKALVVEGRSLKIRDMYRKQRWKNWGDKWGQLLSDRYGFTAVVKHHSEIKTLDVESADLIVMGGSGMNIYLPCEDMKSYGKIATYSLDKNKPIIGSCFGMQMVAHIFGERVQRMPSREFGIVTIRLDMRMLQYYACASHNDKVDLRSSSNFTPLAESDFCLQAVRGNGFKFLGLQHHPEWDVSDLRHIALMRDELYSDSGSMLVSGRYQLIDSYIEDLKVGSKL